MTQESVTNPLERCPECGWNVSSLSGHTCFARLLTLADRLADAVEALEHDACDGRHAGLQAALRAYREARK